jgi:hypothetical protein
VLTVKVLNRTNGAYPDSKVYWTFNGQTHSIADQPYLDMPANSSGRMYFHVGSPTGKYADFIEFTVGPKQFNGNTTRVDAFVLKIAMRLHAADGFDEQVGESQKVFRSRARRRSPASRRRSRPSSTTWRRAATRSSRRAATRSSSRAAHSPATSPRTRRRHPPRTSSAVPARWATTRPGARP